jgi:hypothetical protein
VTVPVRSTTDEEDAMADHETLKKAAVVTISAAALLAAGAGSAAAAAKPQDTAKPIHALPGRLKWQDVTLKRGITN